MQTRPPGPPPSSPLVLSVDLRTGRVRIAGDLDRSCAHHLPDALTALALTPHPVWRVDAARVTFCDVVGVRALARAAALAAGRSRRLQVEGVAPFLARLLDLAGLASLVAPDGVGPRIVPPGPGRRESPRRCHPPR